MSFPAWLALTALTALGVHVLLVRSVPTLIFILALRKLSGQSGQKGAPNRFGIAPRVTEESRAVVKPCPDLLYAATLYDVSKQPLRILAPVPDTYWSISFYATNTNNFFTLNDRQAESNPVEILLVAKGRRAPESDGLVVEAETSRGLIWIRILVDDESRANEYMDGLKRTQTSQLLPDSSA